MDNANHLPNRTPSDCFRIATHRTACVAQNKLPTVARFAIVSKVPPYITQSLSLAERFHQALCKILNGQLSPAITGKSDQRTALEGNEHVFFLPEADQHGYVTHMTLFAPMGFDTAACRALNRLRKVWGMEGFDVKIVLLATGQPDDFALASPYFRPSKTWASLTPFIPVRHPKATRAGVVKTDVAKNGLQIGSPEQDCWRLLEMRFSELKSSFGRLGPNSSAIANVLLTEGDANPGSRVRFGLRNIPCLDFQRDRHTGKGARAGDRGYSIRLDFAEDVSIPFGLGYAAHFGLGLFVPVEERDVL